VIIFKTRAGLCGKIPGFSKARYIFFSVNTICQADWNKGKKYLFFIVTYPRPLLRKELSSFEYVIVGTM
jgi:hypothetical protein